MLPCCPAEDRLEAGACEPFASAAEAASEPLRPETHLLPGQEGAQRVPGPDPNPAARQGAELDGGGYPGEVWRPAKSLPSAEPADRLGDGLRQAAVSLLVRAHGLHEAASQGSSSARRR